MNKVQRDEGFIVAIEGQGGDETFGGYRYHILLGAYDLILSGENGRFYTIRGDRQIYR